MRVLRLRLPFFVTEDRRCFPPELCWRGNRPHQADNSRPLENCVASTSLRNAAAIRGPTTGIVNRWRYAVCCDDSAAISLSRLVIRSFNACISYRSEDSSRRRVNVRLFEASSINSGSCCWRRRIPTGIVKPYSASRERSWLASAVLCSTIS